MTPPVKRPAGARTTSTTEEPVRDVMQLYRDWWAHDGLWYQAVARRFGFEAANELNRECLRQVATRSMNALVRKHRVERAEIDIERLAELYLEVTRMMWPDEWVETEVEVKDRESFEVKVHKSFALALLNQVGSLEHYECACVDIREAWFRALGLDVDQGVRTCKRDGSPHCHFWARVHFPDQGETGNGE